MKEANDAAVTKRRKFIGITIVALAVLFAPPGGAFAQTVHNVLSYGAQCNGTTDDTAALQYVLDSAGAGTVLIPSTTGASCVTRMLQVRTGTRLNIVGRLEGRSTNGTGKAEAVLNIKDVQDVRIWGPGVVDANKAVNAGIYSFDAEEVTVDGLTITNSLAWPVNMTSTAGVRLTGLTLSNGGASPECAGDYRGRLKYTTDCHVDGLIVRNMPTDSCFAFYGGVKNSWITNSNLAGCLVGIQVVSDDLQYLPNDNIRIEDNQVHDNLGHGILVLSWLVPVFQTNVTIEQNVVFNNRGGGIALSDGAQNSIVSSNIIHHNANDPSAFLTEGFVAGIVVKSGTASITSNTIYSEGGTYPGTGILFGNIGCHDKVTVSGNSIYNEGGPQPLKDAYAGWINARIVFEANTISGGVNPIPRRLPLNSLNGSWACYSFGLPEDIPFAGDLNGDQLPLNMVFRPSNATWYINLLNGGDWTPTTTRVVQFGLAGDTPDIPQLVYYEGAAHIAVYRNGQLLVNTTNQTYNGSNVLVWPGP